VHHAHFWQMQEHAASLDTHVVIGNDAWPRQQQIKEEIKHMLGVQFDIHHSTLELERADDAHSGAALFGHDGGCGH